MESNVMKSCFFDAELVGNEYDRVYNADDLTNYLYTFFNNGVFASPSDSLQVFKENDNSMNIIIRPGKAFIHGKMLTVTNSLVYPISIADGQYNRIDRVVIQKSIPDRTINIVVKEGEYATNPVAPSLTRNEEIYELGLADIEIRKGDIKIYQSQITDLRLSNELCGVVTCTIDQVPTETIFNQYQAYLDEKITNNEFEQWFNSFRDKLDPSASLTVQLINKISANENAINYLKTLIDDAKNPYETLKEKLDNLKPEDVASLASVNSIMLNQLALSLELEKLKGSTINNIDHNMEINSLINNTNDNLTINKGNYNTDDKRIQIDNNTFVYGLGIVYKF